MALHPDVEMVVQFLIDQGMFSVDDCTRLARVIHGFQALADGFAEPLELEGRLEREPAAPEASARPAPQASPAAPRRQAARRGRSARFVVDRETLEKLYLQDGLTAAAIASQYGVSAGTVNSRLRHFGLTGRKRRAPGSAGSPPAPPKAPRKGKGGRGRKWKVDKEELEALRASYTVEKIAEIYGVSVPTVNARLREHGLTRRGRRPSAETRETGRAPAAAWNQLWEEGDGASAEERKQA